MTVATLRRRDDPRRRGPGRCRQSGMVTAEIAAALPALVLVIVAAVWAVTVGIAQIRCADAAREAVRAAARGDDSEVVREIAEAVAPSGATVQVTERDGLLAVEVTAPIAVPLPFGDRLPAPTGCRATSYAIGEGP